MSVNKVILVGNLGRDPKAGLTPNAKQFCQFSIATTQTWMDNNGQKQEKTEWHNIVVWGKQAESCTQYLSKGRQVFIEGSLRTRQYDKDGVKHYITEVIAQRIQFLGGGRNGNGNGAGHEERAEPAGEPSVNPDGEPVQDEEVPF